MKLLAATCVAFTLTACASGPRGPSDAEVRQTLDAQLQDIVGAVLVANAAGVVAHFAPDAVMTLRGVMGADGEPMNVDLTGTQQIRAFLGQAGAPPAFTMQVSAFQRADREAVQTGRWNITTEQGGQFELTWHQNDDGIWQITSWRFGG